MTIYIQKGIAAGRKGARAIRWVQIRRPSPRGLVFLTPLGGGTLKSASIDCIRKVCSPVTFHAINSDHFLSDPESRAAARQTIRSFLQTV